MTIWLNKNNYFVEYINNSLSQNNYFVEFFLSFVDNYFLEYINNSLNQNDYFVEFCNSSSTIMLMKFGQFI